ncbi:MAG: type II toxin-antitoxin system RelB/DinJ family antitoxin [Alphaproteobacteria bacterium]
MNTVIQTRIDSQTKQNAEAILKRLGLTLNDGIRMFVNQVTLNKGIPFMPIIPSDFNEETLQVIDDLDNSVNCAKFNTTDELFEDLGI